MRSIITLPSKPKDAAMRLADAEAERYGEAAKQLR